MQSHFAESTWRPGTSVKFRYSLTQGIFIAVVISILALGLYFPVKQRLVTITESSYRLLADNLAASIYSGYTQNDRQEMTQVIRRVEGQKGVKYVLVIDANNTVIYDSISGPDSLEKKNYTDELTPKIDKDLVVGKVQRSGIGYYNFAAPFILHNHPIYTIRLGVDQEVIDGQFNQLARLFLYLGIFGVGLGIIAAYFLVARLTRPITLLTESALAIRAGNLNAYPNITTNDELEQLSREFQNMVEKLKGFYFQEYGQKKEALMAKGRLEEVNSRLKELDRQKSDFLNAASHQLRTPLSVIYWSLSLISEETAHLKLSKQQQELLEESLKSTKRMVDLVNDLLDISRIEQGRKELSWAKANIASICKQSVDSLRLLAEKKKLTLTFREVAPVPASFIDEKALFQAINNFVDNSIKYTAEGSVEITCQPKDGQAVIVIKDTGIGMDEQEKSRLFVRFARGGEATKMFANGSGLGMYVAKSILDQHKGVVKVFTRKDQGTTFTILIPLYEASPELTEAQPGNLKVEEL